MLKKIFVVLMLFGIIGWAAPLFGAPQAAAKAGRPERFLKLPEVSGEPDVIYLGKQVHPKTGQVVEGYAFIHYKDGAISRNIQNGRTSKGVQCYSFLADGAKWKTVEPWVVNPANTRGLDANFIFNNLTGDIAKWEDAADGKIDNGISYDILGNGAATTSLLSAESAKPDGLNEVYFADISTPKAIAVTIVWGIFSGPTYRRQLTEWDMIFDDFDFDWSASGEANKMDFEDIATHELGHAFGMNDLYNTACNQETMYGYASLGETLKRTLNSGDITGISILY